MSCRYYTEKPHDDAYYADDGAYDDSAHDDAYNADDGAHDDAYNADDGAHDDAYYVDRRNEEDHEDNEDYDVTKMFIGLYCVDGDFVIASFIDVHCQKPTGAVIDYLDDFNDALKENACNQCENDECYDGEFDSYRSKIQNPKSKILPTFQNSQPILIQLTAEAKTTICALLRPWKCSRRISRTVLFPQKIMG